MSPGEKDPYSQLYMAVSDSKGHIQGYSKGSLLIFVGTNQQADRTRWSREWEDHSLGLDECVLQNDSVTTRFSMSPWVRVLPSLQG